MQPILQQRSRGSLEQEAEMLPQVPPPLVVRSIAWLIIALFFSALVAAIVVRVPETVRCPFILVPKDGADPIQAPYLAVVSEVRVTEAQEVVFHTPKGSTQPACQRSQNRCGREAKHSQPRPRAHGIAWCRPGSADMDTYE